MSGPDERLVRFSDAEVDRLIQFYTEAEREILDKLNRALLRGNKTEYLVAMKKNVEAILRDLRNGSRTWVEQAIPRVYAKGVVTADTMIKAKGNSVVGGFGAIHQQAAQVLAENTFQSLDSVAQLIGRRTESIYRDLALENIRGSVAGYDSWQQVARNYRNQLAERGVTGFQDVKGRNWNMKTYSEMVARTSTQEAHLQGTANRLVEHGHDLVKVSTHAGACKLCVPWEEKVLSITGKTEGYPTLTEAKDAGLFHPNCFPAGVLVNGPALLAAFARWYEGEIVIITTASGTELPVTPNHPILTPKGWVAAGLLNEGDNIVRYAGQKGMMHGIDPDNQDVPTPIEQVVNSFGKSCGMAPRSVPVTSEDFHGDGVGSDVYVVWSNGLLGDDRNASFVEPSSKNSFTFTDMRASFLFALGTIAEFLKRSFMLSPCCISSISQILTLFGRHSLKADLHGIRAGFGCSDTKACKTSLDGYLVHFKTFCDSFFGFTSKVSAQNVFAIQGDAAVYPCLSKATNRDAISLKDGFNSLFADMEGGRKLIKRLSGSVAADKIVRIKIDVFSGHVYNLQTKDGWYVANSIITHNCRHAYGLHIDLDKEIEELERELELGESKPEYYTEVQGLDEAGKKGLAGAFKKAIDFGLKNSRECLITVDTKTGNEVYSMVEGGKDYVQFPQQLTTFLEQARANSIVSIHNHPSSSSFSAEDLVVLSRFDSVKTVAIIGHDSTRYTMSIGSGQTPSPAEIKNTLNAIVKKYYNHYNDLVQSGKIAPSDAWKEHSHKAVSDLAKDFGWEYRRVMPGE